MIRLFALHNKKESKALLIAYNWAVIPIRNTSLDARHSTDEVACFRPSPPGGNFLDENSGRPYRVLPRLVLACLVLSPWLQELVFEGLDLQC